MSKSYTFESLNEENYQQVSNGWREYFSSLNLKDEEDFSDAYNMMLDSMLVWHQKTDQEKATIQAGHIDHYYLLLEDGEPVAAVHAKQVKPGMPGSYLKLMMIRTHPRFDTRNGYKNESELKRINDVYDVLFGLFDACIDLLISDDLEISSLKIMGNHQADSVFFSILVRSLESKDTLPNRVAHKFLTASTHTCWLEISLK